MRFQVFDNGRPAQYPNVPVDPSWNNSTFDTFVDAEAYAARWLGPLYPGPGNLKLGMPHDYDGHGDVIEIRPVAYRWMDAAPMTVKLTPDSYLWIVNELAFDEGEG